MPLYLEGRLDFLVGLRVRPIDEFQVEKRIEGSLFPGFLAHRFDLPSYRINHESALRRLEGLAECCPNQISLIGVSELAADDRDAFGLRHVIQGVFQRGGSHARHGEIPIGLVDLAIQEAIGAFDVALVARIIDLAEEIGPQAAIGVFVTQALDIGLGDPVRPWANLFYRGLEAIPGRNAVIDDEVEVVFEGRGRVIEPVGALLLEFEAIGRVVFGLDVGRGGKGRVVLEGDAIAAEHRGFAAVVTRVDLNGEIQERVYIVKLFLCVRIHHRADRFGRIGDPHLGVDSGDNRLVNATRRILTAPIQVDHTKRDARGDSTEEKDGRGDDAHFDQGLVVFPCLDRVVAAQFIGFHAEKQGQRLERFLARVAVAVFVFRDRGPRDMDRVGEGFLGKAVVSS